MFPVQKPNKTKIQKRITVRARIAIKIKIRIKAKASDKRSRHCKRKLMHWKTASKEASGRSRFAR